MASLSKSKVGIGILLLILFISLPFLNDVKKYLAIPTEIITFNSDLIIPSEHDLGSITASTITNNQNEVKTSNVIYKKNDIPIKQASVAVREDKRFIPGGQSIGVQLQTLGILVVGHHLVFDKEATASPGEAAEILVGDIILEMNGESVKKVEDVKPIVKKSGEKNEAVSIKLKRSGKVIETKLNPVLNKQNNTFQIGLYIRDSATGIGTISFYDTKTNKYGALGHVISDSDTKKPIEIYKGKIVHSEVTAIEKGNKGDPGEKQAKFSMKDKSLGTITKNSPFGVFGEINPDVLNLKSVQKPLSIALSSEVEEGPAKILTVINGEEVEEFDIEIVNSIQQKHPATKGMVIKVTDKRLLAATGGIVQGMSGSPIIQNGKLIGAVTHVFVNDPTSGYGIHIEWMLEEADINPFKEQEIAS